MQKPLEFHEFLFFPGWVSVTSGMERIAHLNLFFPGWVSVTFGMERIAHLNLFFPGWVSVTSGMERIAHLKCFTPGAKGLCLRQPSLLSQAVNQRGRRLQGQPMYEVRD
jgi:hypothetical protein